MHSSKTFAIPWSRNARHEDLPKTPEPTLEGDIQPPSPPRRRFRVQRKNAPDLNTPIEQFLASVAAADIPVPSIEELHLLDEEVEDPVYSTSQLSDLKDTPLTLHGGSDRVFSPLKTPASSVLPASSLKQNPSWSISPTHRSLESSLDYESHRPSTALSTHGSISLLSYFSVSSDAMRPCVSLENEQSGLISQPSSAGDNGKTIESVGEEILGEMLRPPWTRRMIQQLWSTYVTYVQDPKVTPFRLSRSGIPPPGVCSRVARETKRTWEGFEAQATANQNSGSITSTIQRATGHYIKWPHTCAATRAQLRRLCKMKAGTNTSRNRHLAPSPILYRNSAARFSNGHSVLE